MKNYKVKVEKELNFSVEVDETIWTKEAIEGWSSVFYDAEDIEDIIIHLSQSIINHGLDVYHEGFGYVSINNNPSDSDCKGIKIAWKQSENEDAFVKVTEV